MAKNTSIALGDHFEQYARRKVESGEFGSVSEVIREALRLHEERAVFKSKLLEAIDKVAEARLRRISTGELNRFVQAVTAANPPASPGRREVRILYAAQVGVAPPEFVFFTNVATTFHFSYERFLINQLREKFGFVGSPIRIQVRRRDRNTNVGGDRRALGLRKKQADRRERDDQREQKDRRSRRNRRDRMEGKPPAKAIKK